LDADKVIPLVHGRCFVGEDVPSHEVPHDQILSTF